MNRSLHLYMLEMFTPYLFKSNRRKTSQEHPSAKERSSVLKTLKTVGTMYTLFALSYKNALRITFDLFVVGNLLYEYRKESFCSVRLQIYIQSRIYACNFLSAMKILIYYGTAEIYVSLFCTAQMIGIFQG